jgi:release factor glutamine methyltransferase
MNEQDFMLTSLLKCRRVDLAVGTKELTAEQRSEFGKMVERRAHGEPLQYIIGHCDFMGTTLSVDKSVLIPRPETELLVELALKEFKSSDNRCTINILDLGTGSGNIAITLAKNIQNSSIMALDIHEDSLCLALKNAKDNHVAQKIEFLRKDMITYLKEVFERNIKFDMIITNPPYIRTSDLDQLPLDVQQEPRSALDGGSDGLRFYRSIIRCAHKVLHPQGYLLMEIGDDQSDDIKKLFKRYPQYKDVKFYKDYVGTDRMVIARTV